MNRYSVAPTFIVQDRNVYSVRATKRCAAQDKQMEVSRLQDGDPSSTYVVCAGCIISYLIISIIRELHTYLLSTIDYLHPKKRKNSLDVLYSLFWAF